VARIELRGVGHSYAAASARRDESGAKWAVRPLDLVWEELFPAEQARVIQLLVDRVEVHPDGVEIKLRTEGLANLTLELNAIRPEQEAA